MHLFDTLRVGSVPKNMLMQSKRSLGERYSSISKVLLLSFALSALAKNSIAHSILDAGSPVFEPSLTDIRTTDSAGELVDMGWADSEQLPHRDSSTDELTLSSRENDPEYQATQDLPVTFGIDHERNIEQVHLSGGNSSHIYVTYASKYHVENNSCVRYRMVDDDIKGAQAGRRGDVSLEAPVASLYFTDAKSAQLSKLARTGQWIEVKGGKGFNYTTVNDKGRVYYSPQLHRVKLAGLVPNRRYEYSICEDNKKVVYSFATPKDSPLFASDERQRKRLVQSSNLRHSKGSTQLSRAGDVDENTDKSQSSRTEPFTFAFVGDVGQTRHSIQTLQHLHEDAENFDMVLHAGDLSYADGVGERWDTYGRMSEFFFANMVTAYTTGNHEMEHREDFQPYIYRYPNPHHVSGSDSPLFYSFEAGPAHVIMLGSYAAFDYDSDQYKWLNEDLKHVNRTITPWILAVFHVPWYNSNQHHQGEGDKMKLSMEDLLYKNGVNIVISGHVHAYERSFPVYDGELFSDGITYINIGDGGNREGLNDDFIDPQPRWSAFRQAAYGHGVLEIISNSAAVWKWNRNKDGAKVMTDQTLILNPHAEHD